MPGILTYLLQRAEDELNTLLMLGTANGSAPLQELQSISERLEELGLAALAEALRKPADRELPDEDLLGRIAAARQAVRYARTRLSPTVGELYGNSQVTSLLEPSSMPCYVELLLLSRIHLQPDAQSTTFTGAPWLGLLRGIWQRDTRYQSGPWIPCGFLWPSSSKESGPQELADLNYHKLLYAATPQSTLVSHNAYRFPNAFCIGAASLAACSMSAPVTLETLDALRGEAMNLPLFTAVDPGSSRGADDAAEEYGEAEDGVLYPAIAAALKSDWGAHGYHHLRDLPLTVHDSRRVLNMVSRSVLWPLNGYAQQNLEAILALPERVLMLSIYRPGMSRNGFCPVALLVGKGRSIRLPRFGLKLQEEETGDKLARIAAQLLENKRLEFLPLAERPLTRTELERALIGGEAE